MNPVELATEIVPLFVAFAELLNNEEAMLDAEAVAFAVTLKTEDVAFADTLNPEEVTFADTLKAEDVAFRERLAVNKEDVAFTETLRAEDVMFAEALELVAFGCIPGGQVCVVLHVVSIEVGNPVGKNPVGNPDPPEVG